MKCFCSYRPSFNTRCRCHRKVGTTLRQYCRLRETCIGIDDEGNLTIDPPCFPCFVSHKTTFSNNFVHRLTRLESKSKKCRVYREDLAETSALSSRAQSPTLIPTAASPRPISPTFDSEIRPLSIELSSPPKEELKLDSQLESPDFGLASSKASVKELDSLFQTSPNEPLKLDVLKIGKSPAKKKSSLEKLKDAGRRIKDECPLQLAARVRSLKQVSKPSKRRPLLSRFSREELKQIIGPPVPHGSSTMMLHDAESPSLIAQAAPSISSTASSTEDLMIPNLPQLNPPETPSYIHGSGFLLPQSTTITPISLPARTSSRNYRTRPGSPSPNSPLNIDTSVHSRGSRRMKGPNLSPVAERPDSGPHVLENLQTIGGSNDKMESLDKGKKPFTEPSVQLTRSLSGAAALARSLSSRQRRRVKSG
jgi:hypothetical protein